MESGGLVTFRQCRVYKSRMDEILHRPAQDQDCLADMKNLRGAFPDDMHTEERFGLAMENQLEAPGRIPANLPARYLAIVSNTYLVRNVLFGELFLGLSYEGNLGDGVNAVGIVRWIGMNHQAESVRGRN